MAIPIHNATTRGVRSGPKMSENVQFRGGFFNAKPINQRALRQSHVRPNGAMTLKLYGYIGIGKYLGCVKMFPLGGVREAHAP